VTDHSSRTVVVTGGSAGIGRAICEHFLDAGYRVVALSRRPNTIEHPSIASIQVDLSDVTQINQAAEQIAAYAPTTIVHNAGVSYKAKVEEISSSGLDRLVRLYLTATILLTQACLPAMRKASFGRIVIISSRAVIGLAGVSAYSATKAGQIGLARSWALELGPAGITANVIAPGPIRTSMFTAPSESKREKDLIQKLPARRLGTTDDIARAVMFFSAPENGFVTGQTLFVCGGASVGGLNTLQQTDSDGETTVHAAR
jgi:3-oxoacyl-[acyl-carrier protein] reductase